MSAESAATAMAVTVKPKTDRRHCPSSDSAHYKLPPTSERDPGVLAPGPAHPRLSLPTEPSCYELAQARMTLGSVVSCT